MLYQRHRVVAVPLARVISIRRYQVMRNARLGLSVCYVIKSIIIDHGYCAHLTLHILLS